MTVFEFFRGNGILKGFRVSGHSGYGEAGSDIVCAAVSSAVQLTANGITEVAGGSAEIISDSETGLFSLTLAGEKGSEFIEALLIQAELLREEFPGCVDVKTVGETA